MQEFFHIFIENKYIFHIFIFSQTFFEFLEILIYNEMKNL
jgi:hypothetical protein